jgi:hypothetical protein
MVVQSGIDKSGQIAGCVTVPDLPLALNISGFKQERAARGQLATRRTAGRPVLTAFGAAKPRSPDTAWCVWCSALGPA